MLENIKYLFKKFFILNLVFGLGMIAGSVIGTSVTLGAYGVPEASASQITHSCPVVANNE